MVVLTRAKRRRLVEDEEDLDRISRLPDAVLGEIVSLLSTKDGARTQVISSRWRHLWRSAPLNFDLGHSWWYRNISEQEISSILSLHPGPGRRFSIPSLYLMFSDHPAATLDGWLRSSALGNLEELEFGYGIRPKDIPPPPIPSSVQNFSPTLRVASFSGCGGFPDGDHASVLQFPVLKQLSLSGVSISDSSMHSLLACCPVLESLLLLETDGCSCIRIVSPSLRSIGVDPGLVDLIRLQQVVLEDAPNLGRLFLFPHGDYKEEMDMVISVISAPKLNLLGQLSLHFPRLQFGTTIFQGSHLVSLMTLVPSMRVLALNNTHLSLDVVINFMKCFPCLEELYIKTCMPGEKNMWFHKYRNLMGTPDIRLKKIVLREYRGNKSHINFAKFVVLNASALQKMVLGIKDDLTISSEWIERQHRLLQTENRASRGALFDFVYGCRTLLNVDTEKIVHDLSAADPFVRLYDRSC